MYHSLLWIYVGYIYRSLKKIAGNNNRNHLYKSTSLSFLNVLQSFIFVFMFTCTQREGERKEGDGR